MPAQDVPLKERLRADLTTAIRERDELRSATLRLALTAVRTEEVAGDTERELADPEIVTVLQREARKRKEAAAAFADGGRAERAERERQELEVLQAYLPAGLDEAALTALVDRHVADAAAGGATGMPAMGRVMKAVQAEVAGRADGAQVAALVRARLAAG